MASLYDEDGLDLPFEKAIAAPIEWRCFLCHEPLQRVDGRLRCINPECGEPIDAEPMDLNRGRGRRAARRWRS